VGKRVTRRKKAARQPARPKRTLRQRLWGGLRWLARATVGAFAVLLFLIGLFAFVNPPTTPYMVAESTRWGPVTHDWVSIEEMTPYLPRVAVASEDANFCLHWGLDVEAIRKAMEDGSSRGASTISQQVVKNLFLWHGRSWLRKAMEAAITPLVEAVWTKRRILEVYLNIAEFDQGIFGVEAAARHYFGVSAADLTPVQSARLAAVLPDPKGRSASNPTSFVRGRAAAALSGAETIAADGRAACFER
jgi:monofunctional biosynthetic peptidoglycan transglycosylase